MITNVTAFVAGVTAPDFSDPDSGSAATDPVQIRDIEGLDPVTATINTTQYGSVDGEFYTGGFTGKRNVVLTLGLNPNWSDQTIEGLRRILMGYFTPKNFVTLVIESTHMPTVQTQGYVESMTPNIFSKDPEVQVSIICPFPYLQAVNAISVAGLTVAIGSGVLTEIDYAGDVPTGYILDVVQGSADSMSSGEVRMINNTPTVQIFDLAAVEIDADAYLEICTIPGKKYVRNVPLPSGLPTNLLGKLAPGSIWSPLQPGANQFQVMSATPGQNWTLTYNPLYGGM